MKKAVIILSIIFIIMFQIGILSHVRLQAGKVDLILLVIVALSLIKKMNLDDILLVSLFSGLLIGLISAEPLIFVILYYLAAGVLTYLIRTRVWKIPLITMFFCVGVSLLFHHSLFGAYLLFSNANLTLSDMFQYVIMPSLMLNILFVIPVYYLVLEAWQWFSPIEEDE